MPSNYNAMRGAADCYLTPNLNNYFEFMKKVSEVDFNHSSKKRRLRNIKEIRTEVHNSPMR